VCACVGVLARVTKRGVCICSYVCMGASLCECVNVPALLTDVCRYLFAYTYTYTCTCGTGTYMQIYTRYETFNSDSSRVDAVPTLIHLHASSIRVRACA